MKPYLINLINAVIYIGLGSWGYFASDTPSVTALIPVITGVILLAVTPGFKKENRVLAHLAVVLTFVILIGLVKPLTGAIGRHDNMSVARVSLMMLSSLIAISFFIKSFINARR